MRGLRVDFAMNQGLEMIVDQADGIQRGAADEMELRMLQEHRISGLLPIHWEELNGALKFRYSLQGKIKVTQAVQRKPFGMKQYCELLLGITEALEECRAYLLRPEGLVLEESYLFVGDAVQDVGLAYLPLREHAPGVSLTEALSSLAARWVVHIDEIDGKAIQSILGEVQAAAGNWQALRNKLLQAISGYTFHDQRLLTRQEPIAPAKPALEEEPIVSKEEASLEWSQRPEVAESLPLLEVVEHAPPNDGKLLWAGGAAAVIAIAAIWRYGYASTGTSQSLLVSLGGSLLVGAGLVLAIWKLRNRTELDDEPANEPQWQMPAEWKQLLHASEENAGNKGYDAVSSYDAGNSSGIAAETEVQPPSQDMWRTVALAEPNNSESTCVVRLYEGKEEWLPLSNSLIIGRSGEGSGYVDIAAGVSRAHLEFRLAEDGGIEAADLGSRNGSRMNGAAMIAYKYYALQPEDVIQIGDKNGPRYRIKAGAVNNALSGPLVAG